MSTLSLRLPNSLHRKLKELAASEGISINQLLATAAAEKISALTTEEYLNERAARGRKSKFKKVLKKVPSVVPVEGDERHDA
jgi:predicted DNA-binding ribbon-helix-helix protein